MSSNVRTKITKEQLTEFAKAGLKAPSGGNAQPWIITIQKNSLVLILDPIRSSESWFLDVHRYASIFSLGCVAENIRLRATTHGFETKIQVFEQADPKDFQVHLSFVDNKIQKDFLSDFIEKRITNRHIFNGSLIESEKVDALFQIVKNTTFDSAKFVLKSVHKQDDKKLLASLLSAADGIRMVKNEPFEQMMREFRWSEEEVQKTKDGLDLKTLELPGNAEKMLRLLRSSHSLRLVMPKKALGDFTKPVLVGSSHLCCLTATGSFSQRLFFDGGMVVQRLWLSATEMNIAFQPWTTLQFLLLRAEQFGGESLTKEEKEEVLALGKKMRNVLDISSKSFLVFLFRLSYAKAPSRRSLRLDLEKSIRFVE